MLQPGEELALGVAGMRCRDRVPGDVEFGGEAPQAFDDERVLRSEVAVERHLVGVGGLGNGVDADRVDAVAIEQLARRGEDALAWRRLLRQLGRRRCADRDLRFCH